MNAPKREFEMSKKFASVAEAVAEFFKEGYATIDEGNGWRYMKKENQEVWIIKNGFLDVTASVVNIRG